MEKIKVMHVISDTNFGGAGQYLKQIVNRISTERFDLIVVLPKGSVLIPEFKNARVIEVEGIADKSLGIGGIASLYRCISKERPDLVHTHGSLSGRIAAQMLRVKKIIYTKHTLSPATSAFKTGIKKILNRILRADVIAVSGEVKRNLMIEGIRENKIHVIHNGVAMKEMVPIDQSKPAQIAMIARFERIKGHHHMLEIVKELMKVTDIPFKVVFTGDGSLKESVEKQVREANLPIEFTGHVQAIDDIYGQSQIIVNTSESEAFGFSVVEAMMLGRPVVAFDLPGLREVVNEGVTGILIPPYDCVKFAEALNSLLESPDRLERMGLAGHEWVKSNFTVQKMMNQLEALYMEEV